MSGDRTQHVLDAIDGALGDWSVSQDAMRWTPEPAPSQPIKWSGTVVTMTDEQLNDWPVQGSGWIWISHAPENDNAWQDIPIDDTAWRAPEPEPEPPARSDVRAHALWRAQHRNTGPQRPTAGRSKRPRRP